MRSEADVHRRVPRRGRPGRWLQGSGSEAAARSSHERFKDSSLGTHAIVKRFVLFFLPLSVL